MRDRAANRAETDDEHARAGDEAVALGADRVLRPLARRLAAEGMRQPAEQRERDREHVLGDRVRRHAPRVGDHDRARDHLGKQHAADAGRRAVQPAQPPRRGELLAA